MKLEFCRQIFDKSSMKFQLEGKCYMRTDGLTDKRTDNV